MSWLWTNLILWCSLIWLPWLMCHLLGNEARPKKNIIVGVTLPYEAQADPAVEELLASYQKQLRQAAWLLTVPALPCLFLRSAGLSMTLWFIWIIAACVVPTVPYVRCNRALARLKEERGWKRQGGEPAVIDLKAAAEKTRWISPLWFLPPFLVSLVPLLFMAGAVVAVAAERRDHGPLLRLLPGFCTGTARRWWTPIQRAPPPSPESAGTTGARRGSSAPGPPGPSAWDCG